jgi:hypothetical protein
MSDGLVKYQVTKRAVLEEDNKSANAVDVSIGKILSEREETHGVFAMHAEITQRLKEVLREYGYSRLDFDQKECLDMTVHKIGRILAGNPDIIDHWDDIAGYNTLVANRLRK